MGILNWCVIRKMIKTRGSLVQLLFFRHMADMKYLYLIFLIFQAAPFGSASIVGLRSSNHEAFCTKCNDVPYCTAEPFMACEDAKACSREEHERCSKAFKVDECIMSGSFPQSTVISDNFFICQVNEETNKIQRYDTKCPGFSPYSSEIMRCMNAREIDALPEFRNFYNVQNFECPSKGLFPNPNDCKTYFECDGVQKHATPSICPGKNFFHEVINQCSPTVSPTCLEELKNKEDQKRNLANELYNELRVYVHEHPKFLKTGYKN